MYSLEFVQQDGHVLSSSIPLAVIAFMTVTVAGFNILER